MMIILTRNTNNKDFKGEYLFNESDFDGFNLELTCGNYRLYVKLNNGNTGFKAIALELRTCSIDSDPKQWDGSTTYDELFQVAAYHDGVRHFEMRRDYGDYAGYIYSPNWRDMCALFDKIKQLEIEYCD